ncbi:hypothetical protein B0H13DRAFT_1921973 [Mycena leptocephala]|nr:hypothetical protein B0H13DRAFT_1921973 [Mycena leptocephala]
MPGVWYPLARRTRSGAEFAAFSLPPTVYPLQSLDFDLTPLISRAIAAENDGQDDHEEEDTLHEEEDALDDLLPPHLDSGIDDAWPSLPPPDPWDEVDEANPCPHKHSRSHPPSFNEVVASAEMPHTGFRRHRPAKPQRLAKKHAYLLAKRKAKRTKSKQEQGHVPAAATLDEHVRRALPLATGLTASTLPAASGTYAAKNADAGERYGSKVRRSLANLLGLGFERVKWDGFTPRPIVDAHGRIVAVLAGQPRDRSYAEATQRAFQAICNAGAQARFPAAMRNHRRGLFAAMNIGLCYGEGQTTPCWLNNKEYTAVADGLLADPDIGRMAGFADAAFAMWVPRLHSYYREYDAKLRKHHPHLRRPFPHSTFFTANFNFGRNVWTFKHRDVLNLAFGWCAIQALGRFDATKGGHLVLWDLRLVIEFPAGALILVPSATIAHSNVPVSDDEERTSFTQYSPGGVFRYVDNGFRTVNELAEADPAEYERLMELKERRWEMGLGLLSTMDELLTVDTE